MKSKIRISLDLTPEAKAQLDELQSKSKAGTLIEVFRRAISLYEVILDQQSKGKIIFEDNVGNREVLRVL